MVLSVTSAIGFAGLLWFGGILVVTLLAVVLVGRWWRRRRAEVRQALAAHAAEAFDSEPISPRDLSGVADAAPEAGPRGRA